jgi:hypothetical protein
MARLLLDGLYSLDEIEGLVPVRVMLCITCLTLMKTALNEKN